jgi:hypothetical protein
MAHPTVIGIFDSPGHAEKVRDELVEAGVALHRIVVSRLQPDDEPSDADWIGAVVGKTPDPQQFGSPAAACAVSVVARSHLDKQQIAEFMRRRGARGTLEARA